MSLTSHIKDPQSLIGQFFTTHFPNVDPIIAQAEQQLQSVSTFRPTKGGIDYPYDLVGMAIDYRLRYYFAITPKEELTAWEGAWELMPDEIMLLHHPEMRDDMPYTPEVVNSFFEGLEALLARIQPVGRRLEPVDERALARYCFVLALFETVYRSESWRYGPLVVPTVKQSTEELLAIPTESVIDDLCHLSAVFYARYPALLTRPFTLNPTFAGSDDVDGADADLIVSQCLIDLKTSVKSTIQAKWLYQLLGYVLLDYFDTYHLEWIAIYMARQGKLLSWSLAELLPILTGSPKVSVKTLRKELRTSIRKEKGRTPF